jgi:hypothetical protein
MKLTYWIAECLTDSHAYSIRARTKREVVAVLASGKYRASDYGSPKKVSVEYENAFDLMDQCMSEARGYWEA